MLIHRLIATATEIALAVQETITDGACPSLRHGRCADFAACMTWGATNLGLVLNG